MKKCAFYQTPIGRIGLAENGSAITDLIFENHESPVAWDAEETPLLKKAAQQLSAYFAGELRDFDLPLAPQGTTFQRAVWNALLEIPYGATRSYGQVAAAVGNSKASRAIGMANHSNPIAIIIPCHRVIGSNGKLVGYGGGLEIKEFLLEMERHYQAS